MQMDWVKRGWFRKLTKLNKKIEGMCEGLD
jgi:hypothetical protein